nr:hypothetical protein [Pandoravirus aubagnensis]
MAPRRDLPGGLVPYAYRPIVFFLKFSQTKKSENLRWWVLFMLAGSPGQPSIQRRKKRGHTVHIYKTSFVSSAFWGTASFLPIQFFPLSFFCMQGWWRAYCAHAIASKKGKKRGCDLPIHNASNFRPFFLQTHEPANPDNDNKIFLHCYLQ